MQSLKSVFRWLVIIALMGAAARVLIGQGGGPSEGKPAPDIRASMLTGGAQFDLSERRGRTIVLDFWATWCPPCQASLPALQTLHERYQGTDVEIYGVNTDDGPGRERLVGDFMKRRGYAFPVILDDGRISRDYSVRAIPMLVLIRPDGVVEEAHVGLLTSNPAGLVEAIDKLIQGARKAASGA